MDDPRYIQLPDGTRFDTKQRGVEWGIDYGYVDIPDFDADESMTISVPIDTNTLYWSLPNEPFVRRCDYRQSTTCIEEDTLFPDWAGDIRTELKDGEYEIESMTIRFRGDE